MAQSFMSLPYSRLQGNVPKILNMSQKHLTIFQCSRGEAPRIDDVDILSFNCSQFIACSYRVQYFSNNLTYNVTHLLDCPTIPTSKYGSLNDLLSKYLPSLFL